MSAFVTIERQTIVDIKRYKHTMYNDSPHINMGYKQNK